MIIRGHTIKKTIKLSRNTNESMTIFDLQDPQKTFQEGEKKGYNLAKTELSSTFHVLNKLSQNILSRLKNLTEELKPEIITLCIHICEKIMLQKLNNPDFIRSLLENIVKQSLQVNENVFHFVLSKQDFDVLSPLIQQHKTIVGRENTWEIDPSLSPGSYKIHAKKKIISYHLKEELFLLNQALLNHV